MSGLDQGKVTGRCIEGGVCPFALHLRLLFVGLGATDDALQESIGQRETKMRVQSEFG